MVIDSDSSEQPNEADDEEPIPQQLPKPQASFQYDEPIEDDIEIDGDQWQMNMINEDDIVYARRSYVKMVHGFYMCQTLGEGSYSKVREALNKDTLQRAAVKIMSQQRLRKIPNGVANAEKYVPSVFAPWKWILINRLLIKYSNFNLILDSEIKILRELDHENVIKLLDVYRRGDPNPKMYLFMEYGVIVLQKLIEDSPLTRLPVWQAHK